MELLDMCSVDNENQVSVMMDDLYYSSKPDEELKFIVPRLKTTELTVTQLTQMVCMGYTCRPGLLSGGCKEINWVEQQCFFLDIDTGRKVSEAIRQAEKIGIIPNIIYPSYHYTPSAQRYRMVFIAQEAIRNGIVRDKVQQKLMKIFGCDNRTAARNRVYFGGNACFWEDNDARFDTDAFLKMRWM